MCGMKQDSGQLRGNSDPGNILQKAPEQTARPKRWPTRAGPGIQAALTSAGPKSRRRTRRRCQKQGARPAQTTPPAFQTQYAGWTCGESSQTAAILVSATARNDCLRRLEPGEHLRVLLGAADDLEKNFLQRERRPVMSRDLDAGAQLLQRSGSHQPAIL